ncbi:MAG: glycosyltransferase 2 family protein [Chloroflexota bacterium]|jgi:uncharacterized protein (TIRG00374 family)|nr:glycosyltransferase 2 family protein [Chloroflexota bacterium]
MDRRRVALALVGVGISVVAFAVLAQAVDLRRTLDILSRTDPVPLLAALVVVAVQLGLRSIRWALLLPSVASGRIPARRIAPVLLVGYLGNIALPARLGEVVRAYLVSRREPVAFSLSLGTVVLERVMDLATLALVGFVAAVLAGGPAWILSGTAVVALLGLAVTAFLVVVGLARLVGWAQRLVAGTSRRVAGLAALLVRFGEGAGAQPRAAIATALAISVACWLLDGTTFWLAGRALGVDVAWPSALLIAAVTVLGTAIPSAPGYVGTFELAAVAAANALGIASEPALAMAVLAHVMTTVPLAVGGAIALVAMSVSLKSVSAAASARREEGLS